MTIVPDEKNSAKNDENTSIPNLLTVVSPQKLSRAHEQDRGQETRYNERVRSYNIYK